MRPFLLCLVSLSLVAVAQTPQPRPVQPSNLLEAIAQLAVAELSGDVNQIRSALYQVGRFQKVEGVEPIARYLEHEDVSLRNAAVNALQQNGTDEAVAVLRSLWLGDDATLKSYALRSLSVLGKGYTLEEMRPSLEDPSTHRYAADAIAALGGLDAFTALFTSLVPLPAPELRLPEHKADANRNQHVMKLLEAFSPDEPAPWLLESCFERRTPPATTLIALRLLTAWSWAPAAETAAEYSEAKLAEIRESCCELLGAVGAGDYDEELIDCTKDKDPRVVVAAARALGSVDTPKARKALHKLLKKRTWEMRAIAIHSLGSYEDVAELEHLVDHLDDKAWQVQVAAIKAVARIPHGDAVEALIEQLDEVEGRLHLEVKLALKRLTGEDIGGASEDWQNWWRPRKDSFVFPDREARVATGAALPPATRERGSYYGTEIVSKRVCFLVDISGSMSGQLRGTEYTGIKLDVAKSELIKAISGLPEGAYFNIILFDHGTQPWREALTRATDATVAEAQAFVQETQPSGGTNIYDPLEAALFDEHVDTIYLLTDGSPGSGKFTATEDILREVAKINAVRNIQINTINFVGNAALLEALAEQNSGIYVNIE